MIKDSDGVEITYWPISGLTVGEVSETLEFTVELGVSGAGTALKSSIDASVAVWAKQPSDISVVDISQDPYDLSALSGDVDFELYVEALGPVDGLVRIPIEVFAGVASPAGWTD